MNDEPQNASVDEAAELDRRFQMFKFYEDAAQRTKSDAWTQTTWVLTLSGAILGFSMKVYVEHRELPGFPAIAFGCAAAGLVLTAYAFHVLRELAKHIRNYWTSANVLAASHPLLRGYIPEEEAERAARLGSAYKAGHPKFITRLMIPVLLFAAGHVGWAIYATARCGA
jgi:hypothetical protein